LVVALFGFLLTVVGGGPAQAAPPAPEASLTVPPGGFIGDTLDFTVSFDNADVTDTGFGPFINLFMPASGEDGDDGISFDGATYLGVPVDATVVPITGCPINHPFLGSVDCPAGFGPGDEMVVLVLPFGSFTPGQPAADIAVSATVSDLADVDAPLEIAAVAGFRYGDSPTGSTPLVQDPPATASHTPELWRLSKRYLGPEDETATGPNFPRQYEVVVQIAPGQTIDPLTVTDLFPNNLVYLGVSSTVPAGGNVVTEPPTTAAQNPPDNELAVELGPVTGTGGEDAVVTVDFYVPEMDADSAPVLDPASGDDVLSANEAAGAGLWDPIDGRDGTNVAVAAGDVADPEHILEDQSIAIQKSVDNVDDVGAPEASPGDTLQYTLDFQVSDYFTFGGVTATDVFTDGQTLDPGFTPQITFDDDDDSVAGAVSPGAQSVTRADAPCGNGSTEILFDISQAIQDLGGDGVLTGGRALGADTGPSTGTITFQTVIDSNYHCLDGGDPLDSNDRLTNDVVIAGEVLDNATQSPQPTPQFEDDDSRASVAVVPGSLFKNIYARNDNLPADPDDLNGGLAPLTEFAAGDTITYRLTATLPLTNVEDLSLVDYLPLPVLGVPASIPFDASPNPTGALPPVGEARLGSLDTFTAVSGITPTVTTDVTANSATFDYGNYQAEDGHTLATVDILLRVQISDDPFVDGLLLTNQVRQYFSDSFTAESFLDAIVQFELTEPALSVRKGVVAADNPNATFSPGSVGPVAFSGPVGSATPPRWTGTISSAGLAADPIDSDITGGVDAGDLVTFAVVVENGGAGHYGAFNVEISDSVPVGYEFPAPADLNLQVTDGTGAPLAYTDLGGGLFGSGIALTDPTPAPGDHEMGALAPYDPDAGTNIAVVTYNLRIDHTTDPDPVTSNQTLVNTATVDRYTTTSGGANFVPGGISDPASVTTSTPAIAKTITGTNQAHTANRDVAVGEQVSYEVRVQVPEGEHPNFTVTDTLEPGLAFVSFDRVSFDPDPGPLSTNLPDLSDAIDPGNVVVSPANGGQDDAGRIATFDFGTITNPDTDNDTVEEIVLGYTVVVLNTTDNQNIDPTRLDNDVTTSYGGDGSAPSVTVVEPAVRVDKSVAPVDVDAGDRVTFTLVVSNLAADGADATAFDVSLADVVPAGFTLVPGSFDHAAGLAPTAGPDEIAAPLLSAGWDQMAVGETSTLTFDADIDADIDAAVLAAGLTNTAVTRYTSLPEDGPANSSPYNDFGVERTGDPADPGGAANDYTHADDATVDLLDPGIAKTMIATSEASTAASETTIGEVVTYRLVVTLPESEIADFSVTDDLPAGLAYLGGTATVSTTSPALTEDFGGTLGPVTVSPTGNGASGEDLTFDFGATTVTAGNPDDNSFVIEFDALVLDDIANRGDDPRTGADEATVLPNTASVTVEDRTDQAPSVDVTVVEPIMEIVKDFDPGSAAANDTVTVNLTVTNVGTSDAFDVNVDDLLEGDYFPAAGIAEGVTPTGFTYSAAPEGDNDTRVTYTGGDVAVGETVQFSFDVVIADPVPVPGSVVNTATVTDSTTLPTGHPGGDGNERDEPDVSDSDTLTFTAPDLRVVKNDGVQVRAPGETYTYTVTVFNDGGRDATGVDLSDTLPAGMAFVQASDGGAETAPGTGVVQWPLFDLAAGANRSFTVDVTVDNPLDEGISDFLNTVQATDDGTHGPDPDPADNTDSDLDTTSAAVDIGVVKNDGTQTRSAGETFTYSLTVTNHGNQNEGGITLSDTLPANTSFVSASDGGAETAAGSGVVSWPAFALHGAGGATPAVTYTVTVIVDDPVPAGVDAITNQAVVDSPDDANPANNADSDTDLVGAAPDLTVTKDDGLDGAYPGDTITYDIVVTNVGDQDATGVTVTDTLPAGVSFVSATDGGTESPTGVVTWSLGDLAAPGGPDPSTVTVSVTVTVDDTVPVTLSQLTNTVTVADDGANGADPTPEDNTDTDIDPLIPSPAVEIAKSVYAGHDAGVGCPGGELETRLAGDAVTYCFVVTNTGDTHLAPVTVTDADLGIDDADMSVLSGSLADMAAGDTAVLYYDATVTGDLTNTAAVSGNPSDPDGTDMPGVADVTDDDIAEVDQVGPSIDLAKTVYLGHDAGAGCPAGELATGVNGAAVTYCFTATNTGDTFLEVTGLDDQDLSPNIGLGDLTLLSGTPSALAPGDSAVWFVDDDIAGDLTNTATVTANPTGPGGGDLPGLPDVSDDDTAEVDQVAPAVEVEKTVYAGHDAGAGCPGAELSTRLAGDAVTYCFSVTNTGDTHLGPVTLTDPDLGIDDADMTVLSGSLAAMAPGDTAVLSYDSTVDGDLTNTVVVSANPTDPDGNDLPGVPDVTDDDTAEVDQVAPAVEVEKTVYAGHDAGAGCPGGELETRLAGDAVTYCFSVTNTGDTHLAPVTVTDADLGIDDADMSVLSGSLADMAPGDIAVLYYDATVTGDLTNTAAVTGNPADPGGDDLPGIPDITDDDTAEVDQVNPAVALEKTVYAGHDAGAACAGGELVTLLDGDAVTYCFTATNTGDTFLEVTGLDDLDLSPNIGLGDLTLLSGTPSALAPGDSAVWFVDDDIAGDLTNTATVTANPTGPGGGDLPGLPDVSDDDTAEVDQVAPAVEVEKTVYAGHDAGAGCPGAELSTRLAGDAVTYCFSVTNTGDTHLGPVTLTDPDLGIDDADMTVLSGSLAAMAPGDTAVLSYDSTVAGDLINTVAVSANPTDPDGNDLPGVPDVTDDDTAEVDQVAPAVEIEKTVYAGHDAGAGCPDGERDEGENTQPVTYCFVVTNTGDTHLAPVTVADADLGIDATDMSVLSGSLADMAPGDIVVLYYETTINGDLTNTAAVTGNPADPGGDDLPGIPVVTDDDTAEVGLLEPEIGLSKAISEGPDSNGDGSYTLTYVIEAVNSGEVDLIDVQITDDLAATFAGATAFEVEDLTSPDLTVNWPGYDGQSDLNLLDGSDTLAVYEVKTLYLTVRVTPGVRRGVYYNSAEVDAETPLGDPVDDTSDSGHGSDPDDPNPDEPGDTGGSDDPVPVSFPSVDLAVEKTADTDSANVGDTIHWTIDVVNIGEGDDPGPITVTDTLPVGLSYDGFTGDGWDCTATGERTVECVWDRPLLAGASANPLRIATVVTGPSGNVTNHVDVTTTLVDESPSDNNDTDTITVSTGSGYLGSLPRTGATIAGLTALGVALIAAGQLLVDRRRRHHSQA